MIFKKQEKFFVFLFSLQAAEMEFRKRLRKIATHVIIYVNKT